MKRTVMVVDDDADLRETVCTALTDEGYECVGASNGADALARLRSGELPQLILLDLMMPVMDGWTFREEQMKDPRLAAIPVLVLSALPRACEHAHSIPMNPGAGAPSVPDSLRALRKPMDLDALLAAVSEMIAPG